MIGPSNTGTMDSPADLSCQPSALASLSEPQDATTTTTRLDTQTHTRTAPNYGCGPILSLPAELLDAILLCLQPHDLASASRTCRYIRSRAITDVQWYPHVQENVPGMVLTSPGPCESYRHLYASLDMRWFLPKYKIWFCDRHLMGKLVVVRYDPRRGCIEGYQLLAVSRRAEPQHWPANNQVVIHSFEPQVKLHLDKPVLQFHANDNADANAVEPSSPYETQSRFVAETPMTLDNRPDYIFSNFSLARPLDDDTSSSRMATGFPYEDLWPPPAVPALHRVSGFASRDDRQPVRQHDRPLTRDQVSDQTFRIRQWMEMAGTPVEPGILQGPGFAGMMHATAGFVPLNAVGGGTLPPNRGFPGPHIGEELITYSTLDPKLYTPTPLKPWRGIWVGDYSGHGCEFLLIHQPDAEDDDATDEQLGIARTEDETDDAWEQRRTEARIFRGRLEAIKLTGDPNVPRGEHTFIAEDLGDGGMVGFAEEAPFEGARIVKSKGHVAATGFFDDKFIDSQLMFLSPDRLAQHWVGFGHISYFQRVDLNPLLVP